MSCFQVDWLMLFLAVFFFVVIYGAVVHLGANLPDAFFVGMLVSVCILTFGLFKHQPEFVISSVTLILCLLWKRTRRKPRII